MNEFAHNARFKTSFGSLDTTIEDYCRILYTQNGPPILRSLFRIVVTQTRQLVVEYYLYRS